MEILYTAEATAWGGRRGRVASSDSVLDVHLTVPKGLGGAGDEGTNPEQLFAAGYAGCFHSALKLVARAAGVDARESAVTARVGIGPSAPGELRFTLAVELEGEIPGVAPDVAADLMEQAHQVCPYSNATRGNIDVTLKVVERLTANLRRCSSKYGTEQRRLGSAGATQRARRRRSASARSRLRTRSDAGVISTSSSSAMSSMAVSMVSTPRRRQLDGLVGGVGADVGLLLLAGDVDHHVAGSGVLAHDHALVDPLAGTDEQLAPALEVVEGVAGRRPRPGRRSSPRRGDAAGRRPTGRQPRCRVWSSAVPRVAVSSWTAKPSRPRAGASKLTIVRPGSPGRRSSTVPFRGARAWVTVPTCSSGTSTTPSSTGSWRLPSISRVTTSGRLTSSS